MINKFSRVFQARVQPNGNFGIGTATPGVKLDVNGAVQGTSVGM